MDLDYKEIGKRIARRRKELGLKQSEVEERADLSQKYLSNIERSISIPSIEVIMRLAVALDTTPDEFLLGHSIMILIMNGKIAVNYYAICHPNSFHLQKIFWYGFLNRTYKVST